MKNFFEEFKKFISRGNVLDMAIGVVIGGAFGKISTSLVNDLLMPFISWIFGSRDMTALNVVIRPEIVERGEVLQQAIILGFGSFIGTILDFLLIAIVVFSIVKLANKAHEQKEKTKSQEEAFKEPEEPKPTTEDILSEILNEIRKK